MKEQWYIWPIWVWSSSFSFLVLLGDWTGGTGVRVQRHLVNGRRIERLIGESGVLRPIRVVERILRRGWGWNILRIIPGIWVSSAIKLSGLVYVRVAFSRVGHGLIAWHPWMFLLLEALLVLRGRPFVFPLSFLFLWALFVTLLYFSLAVLIGFFLLIAHFRHQGHNFSNLFIYFSFRWFVFGWDLNNLLFDVLSFFLKRPGLFQDQLIGGYLGDFSFFQGIKDSWNWNLDVLHLPHKIIDSLPSKMVLFGLDLFHRFVQSLKLLEENSGNAETYLLNFCLQKPHKPFF